MIIDVNIPNDEYEIVIDKGLLDNIDSYIKLDRKVLIVTDNGVPAEYSQKVAAKCKESYIETLEFGEESKSLASFERLQKVMLVNGFSRHDCVVAVGGGVIGDLAGFVAASYMRGIDFYNIPTTVLSQVDSSIGGKTAVNFNGVKNIIGAFYQPKKVIIDTDVHLSLPARQVSNGLSEALKMAACFDKDLFEMMEQGCTEDNLYDIVSGAIKIKKMVVEEDVKESGLRKALNFGHTIGHGIEVASDGKLWHGECVGIGMLMMCDEDARKRIKVAMENMSLPTAADFDVEKAIEAISHDKKSKAGKISTVYVSKIGSFEFRDMTMEEIADVIHEFV